jgi:hypothetical protein
MCHAPRCHFTVECRRGFTLVNSVTKANVLVKAASLAACLSLCPAWVRPAQASGEHRASWAAAPPANSSSDTSTGKSKSGAKEKHWSGSLVDVGCMVKVLAPGTDTAKPGSAPGPHTSHFLGGGAPSPQAGQPAGGVGSSSGPGANGPTPQGASPEEDAQRLAHVARVDNAAKQCAPTPATRAFGLATSDGQVVQFDPPGNVKASAALKDTPVEPGKRIKARITGTMANSSTIDVDTVDIKSKGK